MPVADEELIDAVLTESVKDLSLKDLRGLISEGGLSAAGCVDKSDLRERAKEALARLKLPDEASMAPRELACWHENKRTIENSLKTLSGQIYSARARIVYEIIQNADDCSYDAESGEPPQLHIECSDEALCSWHNE